MLTRTLLALFLGLGAKEVGTIEVVVESGYHPDRRASDHRPGDAWRGEIPFHCAMNMIHGVVVERKEQP
jgi:hypothetical protein